MALVQCTHRWYKPNILVEIFLPVDELSQFS
jgi:hypothetical protein